MIVSGTQLAEQVQYRGKVEVGEKNLLTPKSSFNLVLHQCELFYVQDKSFSSVPLHRISNVSRSGQQEVICTLLDGKPFKFSSPDAVYWVRYIRQCLYYISIEWAIELLASHNIPADLSICVLKEVNGFVWSVDSKLNLVEWSLQQTQLNDPNQQWTLIQNRIIPQQFNFVDPKKGFDLLVSTKKLIRLKSS